MSPALSCRRVAELLSQAQDEPLGVLDKMRLKFHLSICPNCQQVEQQMAQLTDLMRNPIAMDDIASSDATPFDGKNM
jgi:predicted anti-sigma-YlaC factor YlaD